MYRVLETCDAMYLTILSRVCQIAGERFMSFFSRLALIPADLLGRLDVSSGPRFIPRRIDANESRKQRIRDVDERGHCRRLGANDQTHITRGSASSAVSYFMITITGDAMGETPKPSKLGNVIDRTMSFFCALRGNGG
jgi:hypothetical protein